MSPNLYNIYAEDIMREVLQSYEGGVNIGGVRYSNLRFTDDTTLMCSSKSELLELRAQFGIIFEWQPSGGHCLRPAEKFHEKKSSFVTLRMPGSGILVEPITMSNFLR